MLIGAVEATTPGDARTRDRVRTAVSEHGPLTAAQVATRLGLTPAAVRRHLDALADAGVVTEHEPPASHRGRGRGRPARAYVLSDAGHRSLGSTYDAVAASALRHLTQVAGPEAVAAVARERVAELESRYAAPVAAAGPGIHGRAAALAAALSADGYAASARPTGSTTTGTTGSSTTTGSSRTTGTTGSSTTSRPVGIQLCQGHCPVQSVATQFPQFCDAETEAFSRLLGVHVQRLATLAHGEHVCTTFVPHPTPPHPTSPKSERTAQ